MAFKDILVACESHLYTKKSLGFLTYLEYINHYLLENIIDLINCRIVL